MQTFFQSVVDSFAHLQQQDDQNVSTEGCHNDAPSGNVPAAAFSWTKSLAEAASQFGISGFSQPNNITIKVPPPVAAAQGSNDARRLDVWRQKWTDFETQGEYTSEMITEAVKLAIRKFHCQLVEDPPTLPPPPSYNFVFDKKRADFALAVQQEIDCESDCQPILPSVRRALLRSIFAENEIDAAEHLMDFWTIYLYQYERFLDESLCKSPYTPVLEQLEMVSKERIAREERERMMSLRVENLKREVEQERAEEGSAETIRPIISSWIKSGEEKITSLLNNPVQKATGASTSGENFSAAIQPLPVSSASSAVDEKRIPQHGDVVDLTFSAPRDIELVESVAPEDLSKFDQHTYRMKDEELDEFEKELGLKI